MRQAAPAAGPRSWDDYPPTDLRTYALLADGHRGALVGPRGEISWLCAPRWDDDAVLSSLIGGQGVYAVTPSETFVWSGSYEPGSLVWRSRWVTPNTTLYCIDALAMPATDGRVVLLRRIEAGSEPARLRVVLDLRAGFGRHDLRERVLDDAGAWTAETGVLRMRWRGAPTARTGASGELVLDLSLAAGEHHDLVLELTTHELGAPEPPDLLWQRTREAWRRSVPDLPPTIAPREAQHSYAVLRGLTAPGGGMVAAATLGLPERARAGRSYDYRYVWLRDQAYAGLAASVSRPLPLLDDAVAFTTARILEHGDRLSPAYRVDGRSLPHERRLALPGYPGGSDVVGNWVTDQFQLDTVGELLQLLASAARHDRLDSDGFEAAQQLVRIVERRWDHPDAGIWELKDAWWSQSRLSVVAGLRCMHRYAPRAQQRRWADLTDAVLSETTRRCLRPDGAWARSPCHHGTDASLALPPVRGALSADDPRTRTTLRAVTRELVRDGHVYRYRPDERPLGTAEGAFLLCGFTTAMARWYDGDDVAAARHFERTSAACGPPGLHAEEIDVTSRQLRGNLPQAFVHALQLETAQRLTGPGPASPGSGHPPTIDREV